MVPLVPCLPANTLLSLHVSNEEQAPIYRDLLDFLDLLDTMGTRKGPIYNSLLSRWSRSVPYVPAEFLLPHLTTLAFVVSFARVFGGHFIFELRDGGFKTLVLYMLILALPQMELPATLGHS